MHIRQPGNFITHFIPAILSIPAGIYLLSITDEPVKFYSAMVYMLCFFGVFMISSMYHSLPSTDEGIRQWRKVDHASIYLMIAGTYTPTILVLFSGWIMWALILTVWGIAAFGATSKLLGRLTNHKISLALYIAMGWLIILVIDKMISYLPVWALFWLFFGGFFYSAGVYFYSLDKKVKDNFGYHEIWHLFVFAGAACHYYYTLEYVMTY